MLRLILLCAVTVAAFYTCNSGLLQTRWSIITACTWMYLAVDFVCENLYQKSLLNCLFSNEIDSKI